MADMQKVKEAAMKRSKGPSRKPKYTKNDYMMWIGGTCVIIVAAMLVLLFNPDRTPWTTPVNDEQMISAVNKNSKTWKAAASATFEGWTIGDVKTLTGVGLSGMGNNMQPCQTPEMDLPDEFDAREKWPQCFNSPIYMMGNCTSSWAISAASALSNRFCISDPTQYSELILSPQHLLSCDRLNKGCEGGGMDTVWNFIEREGLVSEICFPYQADSSVSCESKCTTEQPLKAAGHCVVSGESMIKAELMQNGPVVAPLFLADDIMVYGSGVYDRMPTATPLVDGNRQRVLHAAKLVGWGKMDGRSYWRVENSFGEEWGEQGYLRIFGGGDPEAGTGNMVEQFVFAGTPSNKKVEAAMGGAVDDDADFEADVDLDEEDSTDDT